MTGSSKSVALVAHSGGPTSVINASLLGVIEETRRHNAIASLYGARFGVAGVLSEDFIDLLQQPEATVHAVAHAASSALGSSRRELNLADLERVLDVFRAHNIRYFFYTGGNGSMGTACQIASLARDTGYELHVIGIPKTIDNDLVGTDHTPGYASTARFFACAARDLGAENRALPGQVEILEVLGRNVGWIVAATSLARRTPEDAPHLIYFPEERLPLEKFLDDVDTVYRRFGGCVVAVCEGQLDENGQPFGADVRSGSRGSLAMNLAHRLALLVSRHLKIRARSEKPGLLGRSSSDFVSPVDWNEARMCGQAAVRAAIDGFSGKMVTLVRGTGTSYSARTGLTDLEHVAFVERAFPSEWHSVNDVLSGFREYAAPLIGDVPLHETLQTISIAKRLGRTTSEQHS